MTPPVRLDTSPLHGRGLFATRDIAAGETLLSCPLLILSADDTAALAATRLHHYVFWVRDEADGRPVHAVAFGLISMCNHAGDAPTRFSVDAGAAMVTLTAAAPIAAGAEILIDYGEDYPGFLNAAGEHRFA